MGHRSNISWTDRTWNPWMGCFKVSPGCKQCYMYRDQRRYGNDPAEVRRSRTTFRDPLKWHEPAKVFTCSWSDFFLVEADEWRSEAWEIIRQTPHLTYQILTKRPENIIERLPDDWGSGWAHVWLGVSVEDQRRAEERIPLLLETPAAVRWISAEPLLGPIDLSRWLRGRITRWPSSTDDPDQPQIKRLDWVVVGGESGSGHRPMNIRWLESIVQQCRKARVPVFVKQDGGSRPGQQGRIPNELWVHEWPEPPTKAFDMIRQTLDSDEPTPQES